MVRLKYASESKTNYIFMIWVKNRFKWYMTLRQTVKLWFCYFFDYDIITVCVVVRMSIISNTRSGWKTTGKSEEKIMGFIIACKVLDVMFQPIQNGNVKYGKEKWNILPMKRRFVPISVESRRRIYRKKPEKLQSKLL